MTSPTKKGSLRGSEGISYMKAVSMVPYLIASLSPTTSACCSSLRQPEAVAHKCSMLITVIKEWKGPQGIRQLRSPRERQAVEQMEPKSTSSSKMREPLGRPSRWLTALSCEIKTNLSRKESVTDRVEGRGGHLKGLNIFFVKITDETIYSY